MLPSYTGTITSHCKDPDEPASIMGCQTIWTLDAWFPNPFHLFQGCYFFFEVTTWTVPFLHWDHHANPEPCHVILKSSKRVLKPFTGFRYKKRPPKPRPVLLKKKRLVVRRPTSFMIMVIQEAIFWQNPARAQPGKAASRVQPPWGDWGSPDWQCKGHLGRWMESNGVESSLVLQIRIPC